MALGADVGGSRIKLVRLRDDKIVLRREAALAGDWLGQLGGELELLAEDGEPIGLGVAGLIDHQTGILEWAPHLPGTKLPVGEILSQRLGRRIRVDNDANCATRAEARDRKREPVLVVIVGTGIGAGLWTKGDVYRGKAFAGEAGHMSVESGGEECPCGRRGCWETRISGWRLAESGSGPEELRTAGVWFGRGLFNLVTLLDPEIVVVGGGVIAEFGDSILVPAIAEMAALSDPHRPAPPVVPGIHGRWAGAAGAAMLASL